MAKSKQSKQEKLNLDEIIGKNIRSERQSRNLSRDELAEMLDLTTSHMGLIERGERGATAVTLSKLTKVLQLPIDTFFASPAATAVREERGSARAANMKKINSLTSNLTDAELALVVHVVQGVAKLSAATRDEE
ncbi:MAG: helix-turn-helix domain-containing protein [Defluviitaleaceae bacterium]|nr:helix-turn-helix domain-containing protein [Defluviitaleaceae bacterium]MCL2274848.1 helix-turn-helix domain-containing protein [Defluviitaleaceae bacterium]